MKPQVISNSLFLGLCISLISAITVVIIAGHATRMASFLSLKEM